MDFNNKISQDKAMSMALAQARQGLGRVSPNPPVGAIILDQEGRLLSQGFHKAQGEDHAEIMALKNVKNTEDLKEASMYVTLEPCSFQGQTPSCAKHLAQLPLKKICIGAIDPHHKVNGSGIQILQESRIKIESYQGKLSLELSELIEVFTHNMIHKRPFVSLKVASSLDGSLADNKSQWITGESSREYVQLLRGYHDSVCIGVNTLLTDNPRLNSRHPSFLDKKNKVIILDPEGKSLDFLKSSNLNAVRDSSDIIIFINKKLDTDYPYKIVRQSINKQGNFDIDEILNKCFELEIRSVLVEGGGQVFKSFFEKSQRIYLFLAPFFAGNSSSANWSQGLDIPGRLALQEEKWLSFGQDRLITGRLNL